MAHGKKAASTEPMRIRTASIPPKFLVPAAAMAIVPQIAMMDEITTAGLKRFARSVNGTFIKAYGM